jgi:hypothetical protein
MDRGEELRQWMEIAAADLQVANDTAAKTYPVHESIVCYHCQQYAKDIKSFVEPLVGIQNSNTEEKAEA